MRNLLFTFITCFCACITSQAISQNIYILGSPNFNLFGTGLYIVNESSSSVNLLEDFGGGSGLFLSQNPDGSRVFVAINDGLGGVNASAATNIYSTQTNQLISSNPSTNNFFGTNAYNGEYSFSSNGQIAFVLGQTLTTLQTGILSFNPQENLFVNLTPFLQQAFIGFFNRISIDSSTIFVGVVDEGNINPAVQFFEVATQSFVRNLPVNKTPLNGVLSKDGSILYVLGIDLGDPTQSELYLINTQTFSLIKTLPLPLLPNAPGSVFNLFTPVALSDDGSRMFIADNVDKFENNRILVFDTASETFSSFQFQETTIVFDIKVPTGSSVAYYGASTGINGQVGTFNTATLEINSSIALPFVPIKILIPTNSSAIGIFNNAFDYAPVKIMKGLRKIL